MANWYLTFLLCMSLFGKAGAMPRLQQGSVDLRDWNPSEPLNLTGEWMFYWNEVLEPKDFLQRLQSPHHQPKILELGPSFSELTGETIPNDRGYATYVLRLKNFKADSLQTFGLAGGQYYTSAKVFFFSIDGKGTETSVFNVGTFSKDPATNHPRLIDSHPAHLLLHGSMDHFLLIQVANFHFNWGGIWVPPYIAYEETIWSELRSARRGTSFLLGALLFVCFYNLGLFALRKTDFASLFLGLFALAIVSRTLGFRLFNNEYGEGDFLAFELPYKFVYITMLLAPTLFLFFLHFAYPKLMKRRTPVLYLLLASPYYLVVIFQPALVYGAYLPIVKYAAIVLVITSAYYLWKAYRAKEIGSNISLTGGLIFGLACLLDVLWASGWTWLPPNSLSFGLLFFILAQSQILALRFATAFRRASYLTISLQDEVEQQTRDMTCILESIQQGLFTVDDEDLRIGTVRSPYLNQILSPKPVDGQALDLHQLLIQPMQISNDKKSQITSTLQAAIGEDLFNFDVNASCLVREALFITESGEPPKLLELEWTPMLVGTDRVEKILVCVRDVTEIHKLQLQSEKNREDLTMIEELVSIPEDRFVRFAKRAREFVQQNRTLIQAHSQDFEKFVVDQLFINMHTIKGIARTYLLASVAALSHDIEQGYAAMIKGQREWNPETMLEELQGLDTLFQRYLTLGQEKLGWSLGDKILKVPPAQFKIILSSISSVLLEEQHETRVRETLIHFEHGFMSLIATPLTTVLEDACKGLDSLARDLRKDMPAIEWNSNEVYLRNSGDELLQQVMVHLLRNALDHGIESPAEREAKGKPRRGVVRLSINQSGQQLCIDMQDDGRGLNLDLIQRKAIEQGLIKPSQILSPEEISALIFHSGLSTKQDVSQISGRGVGMDAVQSYLRRSGGDITIQLIGTATASSSVPFLLRLLLPSKLWYSNRQKATPPLLKAM